MTPTGAVKISPRAPCGTLSSPSLRAGTPPSSTMALQVRVCMQHQVAANRADILHSPLLSGADLLHCRWCRAGVWGAASHADSQGRSRCQAAREPGRSDAAAYKRSCPSYLRTHTWTTVYSLFCVGAILGGLTAVKCEWVQAPRGASRGLGRHTFTPGLMSSDPSTPHQVTCGGSSCWQQFPRRPREGEGGMPGRPQTMGT